jgi:hypothetical protein
MIAEKYTPPLESPATDVRHSAEPELPKVEARVEATETVETPAKDPMELPYIYVQDLKKSSFTGYFPDSTVHFEVDLKNGFKDGVFTEYYEGGAVKMKGRFRNDKRDGTWRLYNEEGDLILRRTYEDNEVKREKAGD